MDERCWTARTDVFARRSATSLIALPAKGSGVQLNGPAEAIWLLTASGATADEITIDIARTFDRDASQVRPFVATTLESLVEAGLVDER